MSELGSEQPTSLSMKVVRLSIVNENQKEITHELNPGTWIVGREKGCDIFIDDPYTSRQQFEIIVYEDERAATVKNLSEKGTFLNNVPLTQENPGPIELRPRMTIWCGETYIRILE